LQGIGKADKPERVVRDATALGVASLVFVETARSVSRLRERAEKRAERWRTIAIDAARQCGRGDTPAIDGPSTLAEALACLAPGTLRLVLAPNAEHGLGERLGAVSEQTPVVLLVGPEGGLTDSELGLVTA
jgi:16S rRNA (uracil1498-N3)-methyltransferase